MADLQGGTVVAENRISTLYAFKMGFLQANFTESLSIQTSLDYFQSRFASLIQSKKEPALVAWVHLVT